jgi:signal peptidase II
VSSGLKRKELCLIFLALALALGADRFSKAWVLAHLSPGIRTPFLDGLLNFYLVTNTGAAFSLGNNNGDLMKGIALLVTLALAAWSTNRLLKAQRPLPFERLGVGLILGGSAGNLFDRFTQGCVTDFLEFAFVQFPIFNVADALIDVGVGLILIEAFLPEPKAKHSSPCSSSSSSSSSSPSSNTAPPSTAPSGGSNSQNDGK